MGTKKALQEITLTIRPGEHVALVGENGSGKTTLIKLLCRLYDPTEGVITLDGIDLHEFTSTALRREISVIFQDYTRYHLTARENIWFGNIDLPPDPAQIAAAARYAGADEVISRLQRGYDTILGKWFEEGEELSIGEWQKVALARAFLRNAQIIVLDEPTSAMDPEAEYKLFKRFHQLAEGRTAVLIERDRFTSSYATRFNGAVGLYCGWRPSRRVRTWRARNRQSARRAWAWLFVSERNARMASAPARLHRWPSPSMRCLTTDPQADSMCQL
jgi:ATP-binding cassette subfamily B protein